ARVCLDRCLKPGERSAPVSFYRGVCDFTEGKVEPALEHFQEALEIGPSKEDLGRVLFYVASCHKEFGRFEEAIDALKKAVAADPDDHANHNLLGFCYYSTNRHEEAVECFRRAVEINPDSAIDWASLGSNLRDLGRREEAMEAYRKALSLDPTLDFARKNLEKLGGAE
ncbi:MAG: tetratricopeptide repeat protein, partial [Planctomycetota bacterium]